MSLHSRRTAIAALLVLLAAASACHGAFAPQPAMPRGMTRNLLENPGFEDGAAGWSYPLDSPYWAPFEIVESPVRSGSRSVHLRLRAGSDDHSNRTWIQGVMQEPRPERFPEVLGGSYRVERWEKGADVTSLYLQAVVIVWTRDAPRIVSPGNPEASAGLNNYQLRFYLAGVSEPPFLLSNAKVAFAGPRGAPRTGRWTRFEIPLREEFLRQWGQVPEGYEKLRVLFEARWDNRPPGSAVAADVYYDDLYLGYLRSAEATGPPRALTDPPAEARSGL